MLKTEDGEDISTWIMLTTSHSELKPTIVFSHENAFNMGWRLDNYHTFFKQLDCNIVAYDYRGYGDSTGVPTEKGISSDARAVYSFLMDNGKTLGINKDKLVF